MFMPSVCRIVIGKDRTFSRFPRKNHMARVGTVSPLRRDRGFESPFLQRRVRCEPGSNRPRRGARRDLEHRPRRLGAATVREPGLRFAVGNPASHGAGRGFRPARSGCLNQLHASSPRGREEN